MSDPRPTMADIAERLGVSVSAVSIALSERKGVGTELREKVRRTAREIGYSHHPAAVALRTGRSGSLAVVVGNHTDPVWLEIVKGFDEECARHGLRSVVHTLDPHLSREKTLDAVLRRGADGVATIPLGAIAPLRAWVRKHGCPLVLFWTPEGSGPGIHSVCLDVDDASRQIAEHLAGLGHRRVWLLAGPHTARTDAGITTVFVETARRHGLDASVVTVPMDEEGLRREARAALDVDPAARATAVVTPTDWAAYRVCAVARDLGLSVPGDLSVLGVTDLPASELFTPALTTVRVDREAMGAEAARWLAAAVEALPGTRGAQHLLPCRLVVRDSTGPAPVTPATVG